MRKKLTDMLATPATLKEIDIYVSLIESGNSLHTESSLNNIMHWVI